MARKRGWDLIGTADAGVREIGDGLRDFAEDQRAGTAAKGGAERDQGKIDSAKALGRDAALESNSALKWTRWLADLKSNFESRIRAVG